MQAGLLLSARLPSASSAAACPPPLARRRGAAGRSPAAQQLRCCCALPAARMRSLMSAAEPAGRGISITAEPATRIISCRQEQGSGSKVEGAACAVLSEALLPGAGPGGGRRRRATPNTAAARVRKQVASKPHARRGRGDAWAHLIHLVTLADNLNLRGETI